MINSHREPAALLADANQPDAEGLDLSVTELRAVSPHHRQFMRNMGQISTFSLSLVLGGRFVGMITCAHRTERRLPFNIRDGLEIMANQVALQLGAMREIERLSTRNDVRELRSAMVSQFARSADLVDALLHQHITMTDVIPADGAAVRIGDRLEAMEHAPSVLATLGMDGPAELVTDSLSLDHPELATVMQGVAGLLIRRLGATGDFIAWFRGERRTTVKWLGDMSLDNRVTPLSPRNSFSEWEQEVEGTSEPWHGLRRGTRDRQRSAGDDAATCAGAARRPRPPRPSDRAAQPAAVHRAARRGAGATAYRGRGAVRRRRRVQVDQRQVRARRRRRRTDARRACAHHRCRATDMVARIGGDEFVVLCEDVSEGDAVRLALRVTAAVAAEPTDTPGWHVSASVGVALAGGTSDASNLLSAADSAMYRAKVAGGARPST